MAEEEYVFITVPADSLEDITIDEDVLVDWGTTDRQGDGCLILHNGPEARRIPDDLLEEGILLDYTIFAL